MSHQHDLKPTALPRPGDILLGRYVVEGVLTRGGFATIYRGRQLGVDRTVAIKCLDPESIHLDPAAPQRFSREAKLASGLVHPNTITIFDYGRTQQGILFLVMEYVEGVSLNRVLRYGRIDAVRGTHLIAQMLQSLREAHSKGIVHRDLKPANVMVCDRAGEQDVVKVVDFGIAKAVGEHTGSRNLTAEVTGADRVIGTPRYMAPEQLAGERISAATDLYSVGLILWEMLVGRPAIDRGSSLENMTAQLSEDPIPIPPEVPEAFRSVLKRALEKKHRNRFQSADEFLAGLASAQSGEKQASAPPLIPREVAEAKTLLAPREVVDEMLAEPPMPIGVAPAVPMDPSGAYSALGYANQGGRPRLLMMFNVLLAVLLVAVGVTLGVVIVTQVVSRPTVTQVAPAPAPAAAPAPAGYAVPGGGMLAQEPAPVQTAEPAVQMPRLEVQAARLQVAQALLRAANTAEPLVFIFEGDPVDAEVFIGPDRIGRAGEPLTIARQRLPAEIEIARPEYESSYTWITSASTGAIAFHLDPMAGGRQRSRRSTPIEPSGNSPGMERVRAPAAPRGERPGVEERTASRDRRSSETEPESETDAAAPTFQIGVIDEDPESAPRVDEDRDREREPEPEPEPEPEADETAVEPDPPSALSPL